MKVMPTISLGEIMASRSGSVDPSKFPDEIFDLYSIPAFDSRRPEVIAGRLIGSAKQIVEPNDVLLSKIVPHIRRSWVVGNNQGRRIIASGEWIVFRSHRIHSPYLRHVLMGDTFHAQFMRTVSGIGGSLLRARPAHVARIEIPLPSLPEQRRIAKVLDKAEALRATRCDALVHLNTLSQAVFLEIFGDPRINRKDFPEVAMGSLFSAPPIFGTMTPPSTDGGEWVSIRVANIQNWQLDLSDKKYVTLPPGMIERHSVKDGDLLMARAIASQDQLGKAITVYPGPEKWAFDSHLMRLRFAPKKAHPEFIRHLLMTAGGRHMFLKASRRSAVQFNINTKEIAALRIPIPPYPLQAEFMRHVTAVEKLKAAHRASLAGLDALFASLQYRAFRGEL